MAKRNIVKKSNQQTAQLDLLSEIDKQSYTPEQRRFVEFDGEESVILAATAGAGKTYSCVQRVKELLKRGVDPNKIIFFSFTKAATEELKERVGNKDIKITTIHAFCYYILSATGKFKEIASFYDFIEWFKVKYKPNHFADKETKEFFYDTISDLYEDAEFISSSIASFKLQSADGLKSKLPSYINEYSQFLREKKSRDFSDMLIEVRDMFKEDRWLKMFRGKYDYIFIDEYQDTSTIQLQILLSLNAKYYYLIGDKNQSIYGYSGANCNLLESMVKARRKTTELSLSVNFRSDKVIVENSNKFSSLKAIPNSQEEGYVDDKVMLRLDDLVELLKLPQEVAVLVRTNDVIKKLERQLLKKKVPMRYFNFITENDVENFEKGIIMDPLKNKLKTVSEFFNNNDQEVISFIKRYKGINKFVTTIHKSKGREFHTCVVVNSIAPEILEQNPNFHKLTKKQVAQISFDPDDDNDVEPKNIHYVAVSRSKHKLYFMIYMTK
jgi:DNA helicase-2/ATP-dependent DNA helicase PcrA